MEQSRFGKSLLLSTLKAYWEGKADLFKGLAIERLAKDDPEAFVPHPVFYFDLNKDNYKANLALESVLDEHLIKWEKEYEAVSEVELLAARFRAVIEKAYEKTGRPVVVLVGRQRDGSFVFCCFPIRS